MTAEYNSSCLFTLTLSMMMNESSEKKKKGGDDDDNNDDVCLKARGNEAFQKLRFDEAVDFYTRALQQLCSKLTVNSNDDADDESSKTGLHRRCAVLYSNRSACYFELGRYTDSIREAELCLNVLLAHLDANTTTTMTDKDLLDKNLYRLARAEWCSGGDYEAKRHSEMSARKFPIR